MRLCLLTSAAAALGAALLAAAASALLAKWHRDPLRRVRVDGGVVEEAPEEYRHDNSLKSLLWQEEVSDEFFWP